MAATYISERSAYHAGQQAVLAGLASRFTINHRFIKHADKSAARGFSVNLYNRDSFVGPIRET